MISFHLYLSGASQSPLKTSFEQLQERLMGLDSLYFEPDGSFVFSRNSGREQVFGMVYDAADQVQYCVLRGTCGIATWQTLRGAIVGDAVVNHEVLLLPEQELQDLQTFESCLIKSQSSER